MSEKNGLPKGWGEVPLGMICKVQGGFAFSSTDYQESGIPLVRIGNLVSQSVDLNENTVFLPPCYIEQYAPFVLKDGDVLIALSGATTGKMAVYHGNIPALLNQRVGRFCFFDEGVVERRFIFLLVEWIRASVVSTAYGAAQPNISTSQIESFSVRVPPCREQKRIVGKIDELFSDLDAGVAALKRAKANLKRYRAAVLKAAVEGKLTAEWRAKHPKTEPTSKLLERILTERRKKWEADQLAKFAEAGKEPPKNWKAKYVEPKSPDKDRIPDFVCPPSWTWATLDAVAYVTKLAGFEYTKYVEYDPQGDLAVIKAENAGKHGFHRTAFSRVHSETVKLLDRSRLQGGELLMVFVGAGVGKVAIVPADQPYFLGPNIGMIRIESSLVSPEYTELFLRSALGYGISMSFAKAVAQPSLSMGTIRQIPVLIPPIDEQKQIVAEVEERLSVLTAAEQQMEANLLRATRLRQSILKQAFEGKLVPQDPNDESASVILKRITAERREESASSSRRDHEQHRGRASRKGVSA